MRGPRHGTPPDSALGETLRVPSNVPVISHPVYPDSMPNSCTAFVFATRFSRPVSHFERRRRLACRSAEAGFVQNVVEDFPGPNLHTGERNVTGKSSPCDAFARSDHRYPALPEQDL